MFKLMRWEGDRHTGRHGFDGLGLSGWDDGLYFHSPRGVAPHFVTSPAGWDRLQQRLRDLVILEPVAGAGVARLGGGYDGHAIYAGECPCTRRPLARDVYSFLPEFAARAVADAGAEFRASTALRPGSPLGPWT